jgi:iron complex outermembrane recepter protein
MKDELVKKYTLMGVILLVMPAVQAAPELLETLIVKGKATDKSEFERQLITRTVDDFSAGARLDPAELLQRIPGVQVDSRSNYAQDTRVSLRGFGARSAFGVRGIDLSVDGIPMSTPDGQGQLASVMLDNIERVEVLRGPLAVLYGNGAGGVIALQTAAPEVNQLSGTLVAADPDLQRQLLQGEWRHNNSAARVQIATTKIDGERPHSQAEREQVGLHLFYRSANNIDVLIKHDESNDPLLQDPLGLTPQQWRDDPWQLNSAAETYNTRKTVKHNQTSLSLREAEGATRWQASLWQGERAINQYLGFSGDAITSSGGVVDLARDFYGVCGNIVRSFEFFTLPADWSLGAEVAQMQDRRRGFVNNLGIAGDLRRDELGKVDSHDIFTLLQINPTEQLMLYAGTRHSEMNVTVSDYFIVASNTAALANPDDSGARSYRENSYAGGFNYSLTDQWQFFVSSGRGFETPTLTEMAYRTNASGLNTTLDAAISNQQQWGVSYRADSRSEFTFTRFLIATENELVVDQSVNGRTSFRNATETARSGVELFGRYQVNDSWNLQISLQKVDAQYSAGDLSGKQLPGVAREQYQLGLEWLPFAQDSLQLHLDAQRRSGVYSADNNVVLAPAYTTYDVDITGNYVVNRTQVKWWIKVANLTDENYVGSVIVNQANGRAFEPALGRQLLAGITMSYSFK